MIASLLALAIVLSDGPAQAHTVGLSQGTITRESDSHSAHVELSFAKRDHEMLAGAPFVSMRDQKGAPCTTEARGVRAEDDGFVSTFHVTCEATPESARFTLWPRLPETHTLALRIGERDVLVDHTQTEVLLEASPSSAPSRALRLGFEHVALGYDHLLFLFGLALTGTRANARLRRLVLAVTAFTILHTAALAVAFRGIAVVPERLVEVLIACSIGYLGLESRRKDARATSPVVSAVFGCVHGLGFGRAFRGALGSTSGTTLALATVGVEAAQLLGLAISLGLLALPPAKPDGARAGLGYALVAVGAGLALYRAFA